VQYATFPNIGMKNLLPKLSNILSTYRSLAVKIPSYKLTVPEESNEKITHSWFWPRVGEFFKPQDVIVAETGLSNRFPDEDVLWLKCGVIFQALQPLAFWTHLFPKRVCS
jgi:TPP-dependent 2-oxoacid decarboxylase